VSFLWFVITACGAMLFLASCAHRKLATIRYSPPSTAPVQEKISDAKSSNTAAISAADSVTALIAEAQTALAVSDLPRVGHALGVAESMAKDLGNQLSVTQSSLTIAGDRTLLLDSAVRNQTTLLNNAIDEKNAAITARDVAVSKYHRLKFFVCLLAAGAVLSLAWRFRGLLAFIPPPYNLVAIGALPVITFTALWIRL
jgi:hypothetical protein